MISRGRDLTGKNACQVGRQRHGLLLAFTKKHGSRQAEVRIEAQFWLNLQLIWDLYQAIHSPAAEEIQKISRLSSLATIED